MTDWIDKLKEDIGRETQEKTNAEAEQQNSENKRRQLINLAFSELEHDLGVAIPTLIRDYTKGKEEQSLGMSTTRLQETI